MGSSRTQCAASVMETAYVMVPAQSTPRELINILDSNTEQTAFPVTIAEQHSEKYFNQSVHYAQKILPGSSADQYTQQQGSSADQYTQQQGPPPAQQTIKPSNSYRSSSKGTNASPADITKISSAVSQRLVGTVSRRDVYLYLKDIFSQHNSLEALKTLLPLDAHEDDLAVAKAYINQQKERSREALHKKLSDGLAYPQIFILGEDLHSAIAPSSSSANNQSSDAKDDSRFANKSVEAGSTSHNETQFSSTELPNDGYTTFNPMLESQSIDKNNNSSTHTKSKTSPDHDSPHDMKIPTLNSQEQQLPEQLQTALKSYSNYQKQMDRFVFGTDDAKWHHPPKITDDDWQLMMETLDDALQIQLDDVIDATEERKLRMNAFPFR